MFLHRERVEQSLRGVFVRAVTGVYHRNIENLAEIKRRARGRMADHEQVGLERLDILRGIAKGFAFRGRAAGGVEGDHVGAQALGCHIECHAGARAWLKEEVHDGLAAQSRKFFDTSTEYGFERGGGRVDLLNLGEA